MAAVEEFGEQFGMDAAQRTADIEFALVDVMGKIIEFQGMVGGRLDGNEGSGVQVRQDLLAILEGQRQLVESTVQAGEGALSVINDYLGSLGLNAVQTMKPLRPHPYN
jgi:hypothetical protein